jgi:hypothetical protein
MIPSFVAIRDFFSKRRRVCKIILDRMTFSEKRWLNTKGGRRGEYRRRLTLIFADEVVVGGRSGFACLGSADEEVLSETGGSHEGTKTQKEEGVSPQINADFRR